MRKIRVMQSFGAPRPTTNPYIVMLRDCLAASDEVEHLPFSWRTALTGSFDVLHVHWPDTLLAGRSWATRAGKRAAFAALLARLRLRRTAVVRTVHNLSEPAGPRIDRALISALDRLTTLRIRISASTPETPGVDSVLIPHGHYRDWYADMPREDPVPGRLAYIGLVKPYKGVDGLVTAFEQARADDPSLTLDISGKPADEATARWMRTAQEQVPGLTVTARYVDENEFVAAVTRAALVVLPYRHMHNSGSALAALSLDRPVLVPENPTTRALAAEVGGGWVRTFSGELTAADLRAALAVGSQPIGGRPNLAGREWSDAASRHAAAYRRALVIRSAPRNTVPARERSADG